MKDPLEIVINNRYVFYFIIHRVNISLRTDIKGDKYTCLKFKLIDRKKFMFEIYKTWTIGWGKNYTKYNGEVK